MKLKPEQEQLAVTIMKSLPLFSNCPDEALQMLVAHLDARDLAKGKVLIMDQEIGRTLFILVKGSVSVWKRVGGEKRQLAILQAPDFVGERTMFEESPASALVKLEDAGMILALERSGFDEVAQKFPVITEIIKKNMEAVRAKRLTPGGPKPEGD